jgi:CO/xanthine dehydrogenase Mo-binding subunit
VGSAARRDASPELKDLLGHATLAMVMRYAHLAPEHLLNPKTARSQLIGAMTFGVSYALLEADAVDPRSGAFVNRDLAEYLVAVHADIRSSSVVILRKAF